MTLFRRAHNRGFAVVSVTVLLAVILALGVTLIDFALSGRRAEKQVLGAMAAEQAAEAGVAKAVACLNALSGSGCGGTYGMTYVGEAGVTIGGGSFTTNVVGVDAEREVASVGTAPSGVQITVRATLTTTPATSDAVFSYALQAGEAGAFIQNNATVHGTIYANGGIGCGSSTTSVIDGDAYVSVAGGQVDNCKVNFHAHADRILSARVLGDAYFRTNPADIAGSTVSGTKYPGSTVPEEVPLPVFDLVSWRAAALEGPTISGNYAPADNSSLGPAKIDGDLVMDNNVDLNVTGTIWVTGRILTGSNAAFRLDPGFGAASGVIFADDPIGSGTTGTVTLTNNTTVNGSGDPKSHIMFVATNASLDENAPALDIANNAAGAVFLAPNGVLRLRNNAGATSMAAKKLYLDNNATVTYDQSGLAGLNFSNSPGGIWRRKPGTWRAGP